MRASSLRLAIAALLAFTGLTVFAEAADMTKKQNAEKRRFAYNNSLFVLYHEVAHLLFDQMQLPVLGREEDAADNLATWTLLNKHTKESDRALSDAAQGWILSGIAYNSGGSESDFAAGHSLDKQRAYQIVCMMVGMDQKAFQPIANKYRMDNDRQDSCQWDFETVDRSLKGLLGGRGSKPVGGTEVSVTYHDAGGDLENAADAFKSSGVFDEVADELRRNYSLSDPVQFNARRCGEANAFYDSDTDEVIFCYELMEDYMELYKSNMNSDAAATLPGGSKNKTSAF